MSLTDHTPAAQAAHTNPLSDEYVNAVIQHHGYQSTETVIARLNQWIGLHGGENGVTLLMYEAHKALSKLRAPVADERDRNATISEVVGLCNRIPGATTWNAAEFMYDEMHPRAALASAPMAELALAIHWPDCWDTAAYPTLESALSALTENFRCTNQDTHHTITTDADAGDLGDPSALAALADGLESIAGNENAALAAAYIRGEADRLASAQVDPEAAEVDFLVRVLENLETWRAEDWSELLERRPAILALLHPLVQASAPVADIRIGVSASSQGATICIMQPHADGSTTTIYSETHPLGDSMGRAALASAPVAGEAPPRPDDREIETIVQGLGMRWDGSRWVLEDADLHPLVRALLYRYTAAPQASEAVRTALHDLVDVLQKRHFGRMPDEVQRAFDAARAALSAQPGAQKKESRVGTNTGHGHVWRRPDGYLARCGGPAICRECARDQAQAHPDNKDGGAVYG